MKQSIKISKKSLAFVGLFIIVLVLVYFFMTNYQKQQKENAITQYKVAVYNSLLCQYSCPAREVTVENQTFMSPAPACVKSCTQFVKQLGVTNSTYTEKELTSDHLFADIDQVLQSCKRLYTNEDTGVLNYTVYFECNANGLGKLKTVYSYVR